MQLLFCIPYKFYILTFKMRGLTDLGRPEQSVFSRSTYIKIQQPRWSLELLPSSNSHCSSDVLSFNAFED